MTQKPITDQEALNFHSQNKPGKLEITPTKPLLTQRDLALAYSPGVAIPCKVIANNPNEAYQLTSKGNLVAVISNGSAILGLGNLGALASKPVMEGKAVLFKRFANIDAVDLEIDSMQVDAFVDAVKLLAPSFGGINLEDIKAPECFLIEEKLKAAMDIPVFHDDQHGTAVIAAAGLINAIELAGKKIETARMVINGAGAAAIACANLILALGLKKENLILCDSRGVIYQGRNAGMNQWKESFAQNTPLRTLKEAVENVDIFLGVSVANALTPQMLASMAPNPIVFALANPNPEILPEIAKETRKDVIIATGRSDYPNQVNNVLGFPYIFRGALDVRASEINDAMKLAAAKAIAALAKKPVPQEVSSAYQNDALSFGPNYIIPTPFDPRLMIEVSAAVAEAAIQSGIARNPITNLTHYKRSLAKSFDQVAGQFSWLFEKLHQSPKHLLFTEGEEINIIEAAVKFIQDGFGQATLFGNKNKIKKTLSKINLPSSCTPAIIDIDSAAQNPIASAIEKLTQEECDGIILGGKKNYIENFKNLILHLPKKQPIFSYSLAICERQITLIADPAINPKPDAACLAYMAKNLAKKAEKFALTPQIAFISYSNFDQNSSQHAIVKEALSILDKEDLPFLYDGEMTIDAALNPNYRAHMGIETKLKGKANILIMPSLETAHIASKLLGHTNHQLLGPFLIGLDENIQIATSNADSKEIEKLAALTAYEAILPK